MTREDALHLIGETLATVLELDPGSLSADVSLDDIGADSIARVELAEIVERRLGHRMRFEDEDLGEFRTVGEAADYVLARI